MKFSQLSKSKQIAKVSIRVKWLLWMGTTLVTGFFLVSVAAAFLMPARLTSLGGVQGHIGPGGIGNGSNNNLWFDVSALAASDGDQISSFSNRSAHPFSAYSNNNNRPQFHRNPSQGPNGKPFLRFDGNDDILFLNTHSKINNGGPYEQKTLLVAFRTDNNVGAKQYIYEQGGTIRGLTFFIHANKLNMLAYNIVNDDADSPWGPYVVTADIDPNTAYLAMLTLDYDADEFNGYLNGQLMGTFSNVGRLHSHGNDPGIGAIHGQSHDGKKSISSNKGNPFRGDLMELISFDGVPNTAQRRVLHNYLGNKYDINVPGDAFDFELSHSFEVAGIWQEASDGSSHTDAQGPSILRIQDPSDLDDGEGLIWGHSGEALGVYNGYDVDGIDIFRRLQRSWRVTRTRDPGLVDLEFDVSDFANQNLSSFRLIIDRDGDNFQTLETPPLLGSYDGSAETLTFEDVAFQDGDWFTLGATDETLPVEWMDLDAVPEEGAVSIRWSTARELNNDFFTVERSSDGKAFESVTEVEAVGSSEGPSQYQAYDHSPETGKAYYRVRQTDLDGGQSYSPQVEVTLETGARFGFSALPNPVASGQALSLRIQSGGGDVEAMLVNMQGQVLKRTHFSLSSGLSEPVLSLPALTAGTYILTLSSQGRQASQQIIVRE